MEFEKQIAKQGAQTADAQYIGLIEPPKTGTGAKGAWKKSKLNFKMLDKENPNKFVFWDQKPESKSQYKTVEELTQFNTYRIVWYEKEESFNTKEWVSKTIQIIKDHDETTPSPQGQPQQQQAPATPAVPQKAVANDWVQFKDDYTEKYKEDPKRCNVHMLGVYVFNKHKEQFTDIITLCNKTFGK